MTGPKIKRESLLSYFFGFSRFFLFLLRYPMLWRAFRNYLRGALKALPCVGV
jgi:hypothetical protein